MCNIFDENKSTNEKEVCLNNSVSSNENAIEEMNTFMIFFKKPELTDSPGSSHEESKELITMMDFFDEPKSAVPATSSAEESKELITMMDFFDEPKSTVSSASSTESPKELITMMDFFDEIQEQNVDEEKETKNRQSHGIANKIKNYLVATAKPAENKDLILKSSQPDSGMYSEYSEQALVVNPVSRNSLHSQREEIADKEHPTAISTREKLKKRVCLFVCDRNLYVFNNFCYEMLSHDDALLFIAKHCREDMYKIGNAKHASAVYDALLIDPDLTLDKKRMNSSTITFDNGYLDLSTFILYNHSPQNISDFRLSCNFNGNPPPNACPNFNQLLYRLAGGDSILIQRIWEMFGYCLSPDTSAKAIFVLQGVPNSGKSLITKLLTMFYPENHVTSLNIHELERNFTLSELVNKRLCIFPDMPSKVLGSNPVSMLKQLSGNDTVTADVKYKGRAKFTSQAKFICATNHPFRISEYDEALEERLVAIPFNYSIPKEERNPNLIFSLWQERDTIASIALSYYRQLVTNHYRFAGNYLLNTLVSKIPAENYVDTQADIATFLDEHYCFYKDICTSGNEEDDDRNDRNRSFIDDMHQMFTVMYYAIQKNAFSAICAKIFDGNPYVIKTKHRRNGKGNALSCFNGLVRKSSSENMSI